MQIDPINSAINTAVELVADADVLIIASIPGARDFGSDIYNP